MTLLSDNILPFETTKCNARINTGRQCINNKYGELNYCKIHKKKLPFGDFNIIISPLLKTQESSLLKNEKLFI